MTQRYEDVVRNLTAPGAPFEVITETVRGRPMKTFKNRERSLREKVANCGLRGDATCMVQGARRLSYRDFARLSFGAAARLADGHGLRKGDRRVSYGAFARHVWGAARALTRDHGLAKGDRVAILSYNCPDWLIALFGAVSAGGIGVGLNGWWATEEIEYGLVDSGSRYLVVDERLWPRVAPIAELLVPSDAVPDV